MSSLEEMEQLEKEAVKYFYNLRATIDESNRLFGEDINVKCGKEMIKQITIVLNLLEKKDKENKELKTITNQYEAYECEAPKDSKAKIIIADKFYFNNGYFKNNFIEIDKIKRVFEDFEKIMKEGEGNV